MLLSSGRPRCTLCHAVNLAVTWAQSTRRWGGWLLTGLFRMHADEEPKGKSPFARLLGGAKKAEAAAAQQVRTACMHEG